LTLKVKIDGIAQGLWSLRQSLITSAPTTHANIKLCLRITKPARFHQF